MASLSDILVRIHDRGSRQWVEYLLTRGITSEMLDAQSSQGRYGSGSNVPTLTIDKAGRVTAAANTPVTISGVVPPGLGLAYQLLQVNSAGTGLVYDAVHLDQANAVTGRLAKANQHDKTTYIDQDNTYSTFLQDFTLATTYFADLDQFRIWHDANAAYVRFDASLVTPFGFATKKLAGRDGTLHDSAGKNTWDSGLGAIPQIVGPTDANLWVASGGATRSALLAGYDGVSTNESGAPVIVRGGAALGSGTGGSATFKAGSSPSGTAGDLDIQTAGGTSRLKVAGSDGSVKASGSWAMQSSSSLSFGAPGSFKGRSDAVANVGSLVSGELFFPTDVAEIIVGLGVSPANYSIPALTKTALVIGDMIYRASGGNWAALAAGTNGKVLASTGTGSPPAYRYQPRVNVAFGTNANGNFNPFSGSFGDTLAAAPRVLVAFGINTSLGNNLSVGFQTSAGQFSFGVNGSSVFSSSTTLLGFSTNGVWTAGALGTNPLFTHSGGSNLWTWLVIAFE